ncbi:threonine ammonia-lyase [Roseibium porphyridii]|uniref:Threonine ammonia-lyase n=1 Tax=Roseibium porphyridii TaxID=2866279 RepID=A0ABY8F4I0_9HYPH|nr:MULTISPECIES: threonine ammonia-lyase [Stappiaceae]QFT32900.1 L-threonine dehydratase catabolic TdcB [Labrenzia sp. THAF82]WFE88205.1 threonine ammonia-lyase [Roseibium sp. KMA01]
MTLAFNDPQQVTFDKIKQAAEIIKGAVLETPCLPAPRLSQLTGADIFVKYENMQVTGAFKERGALVKLSGLTDQEKSRGVIAVSAGNHAQGVAYHAGRLGIPATIVMPVLTPFVKIAATRGYGAEVVLAGNTLADAKEEADRLALEKDLVWVHPYDDAHVIHGQGTIALEMLAQQPDLEVLVIPVGGGGLISGIATAAKALKPSVTVTGVETTLYPGMWGAFYGKEVRCEGATIAEGIAVRDIGQLTTEVIKDRVDDILLVSESSIEQAINAYLTLQRTIAEGAGAAGLAALLSDPDRFAGKKVGLVLCGGNIDPRLLSKIVVRELARDGRLVSIRIDTPDRPGTLGEIATVIGDMQGNVVDVEHHRLFLNVPAKGATLDVTFEAFDRPHGERIVAALRERGFVVRYLEIGDRMD